MEPVVPVQMNMCQSNTYRTDLSWLDFNDEPRVQEKQQVKDQQSCIFIFVAYPTMVATRSTSPDMTTVFHPWLYDRFMKIQSNLGRKKLNRTNQGSNFLGGSFSNRDTVRAPIQFGGESQPQYLIRWFFLKNRPIHFHIHSNCVIRLGKWKELSFSCIEIIKPLPAPVHSVL